MAADEPTIREAVERDVPTILALIRELAEYEKALSSCHATEALLRDTLSFADKPQSTGYAKTLLVFAPATSSSSSTTTAAATTSTTTSSSAISTSTSNPVSASTSTSPSAGEPRCAGMALYFPTYSTWHARPGLYLEDLFVRPEFRGRGYATLLLRRLARETLAMGGRRLEWKVLDWNEPSIRFYEGKTVGAQRQSEWMGMRVEGDGLEKLAGGGEAVDGT